MGLIFNTSKCELIAYQGVSVSDKLLQSFMRVDPDDTTLLGAPLFPEPVSTEFGLIVVTISREHC